MSIVPAFGASFAMSLNLYGYPADLAEVFGVLPLCASAAKSFTNHQWRATASLCTSPLWLAWHQVRGLPSPFETEAIEMKNKYAQMQAVSPCTECNFTCTLHA
eukprot:4031557-Amphidinium_carterae.2